MFFDLAITVGGILPFYVALLWLFTKQYQAKFVKVLCLFLLSGAATIPFFVLRQWGIDEVFLSSLFGPLYSIILIAFAEEIVKSLALFLNRDIRKHYYYPILIGLGFAFFENISYFYGFDFTSSFILIAIIRFFMGSTAHAVFTTMVAHFINKSTYRTKTLYYLFGIFLAGSFHSIFNLLHHWEMSYLTVPLLIVLIVYLHYDQPRQRPASASLHRLFHNPARMHHA